MELLLWSCGVGAVELEQELERPPDPRPHDQVKCLFFILFLFVLFEEASKLQAPELLWSFSGASRLRSLLAATKPCNAPSSRACPASELAQGSIQVKGLIGETGRRCGTLRANTESDVQTARGLPGSQITDRLVQTC